MAANKAEPKSRENGLFSNWLTIILYVIWSLNYQRPNHPCPTAGASIRKKINQYWQQPEYKMHDAVSLSRWTTQRTHSTPTGSYRTLKLHPERPQAWESNPEPSWETTIQSSTMDLKANKVQKRKLLQTVFTCIRFMLCNRNIVTWCKWRQLSGSFLFWTVKAKYTCVVSAKSDFYLFLSGQIETSDGCDNQEIN